MEKFNFETMELNRLKENAEEKSISQILEETKDFAKIAKDKEVEKVYLRDDIVEKIQHNVENLKLIESFFPHFKDIFLNGVTYSDGSTQKSVVDALMEKPYQEKLNQFLTDVRKNKDNSLQDFHNYMTYHDLSANPVEVATTFDVSQEAIPIIIQHLEQNNIIEIDPLISKSFILISRIAKLYCFYGYYMEDIGCPAQYTAQSTAFEGMKQIFTDLISIICDLTKNAD